MIYLILLVMGVLIISVIEKRYISKAYYAQIYAALFILISTLIYVENLYIKSGICITSIICIMLSIKYLLEVRKILDIDTDHLMRLLVMKDYEKFVTKITETNIKLITSNLTINETIGTEKSLLSIVYVINKIKKKNVKIY